MSRSLSLSFYYSIVLFSTLLLTSHIGHSQSLSAEQKAKLDQLINEDIEGIAPGLALGIVRDGKIIYENYAGYANLNHEIKIDAKTRFNIASNAKQFTALCILHLVDKGKVKLKADIRTYLPELYPDYKGTITVQQLINHTSGIRDVYALLGLQGKTWWAINGFSNEDAIELLTQQKELNLEPGSQYLYSNSNYILLTEIVGRVTKKSFAEYALALFQKLGMKETSFCSNYMDLTPHKARPYAAWGKWIEYPSITNVHGDGGLFTSLKDQLLWEQSVQTQSSQALSAAVIQQSQALLPTSEVDHYGYGLEFSTYNGIPYIYHDGETGAYKATFLRFPSEKLSIVLMANSGQVASNYLAKRCAKILIPTDRFKPSDYPERPPVLAPKTALSDIVGYYKHTDGALVLFQRKGKNLFWKIGQNRPFKFQHEEGNLYNMTENARLKVSFHLEEEKPYMVVYYPGEEPRIHHKILPLNEVDSYYTALNGQYFNTELEVKIKVEYTADQQYSVEVDGEMIEGIMREKDIISVDSYEVKVRRDAQSKVVGLLVNNSRLRNVRFDRSNSH